MTEKTNPTGIGHARGVSPKIKAPKILPATSDVPDRKTVNRCAGLFKNLKLEPLKFDNKRSEPPHIEPDMPLNRRVNHRKQKIKQKPNTEMQLMQHNSNYDANVNPMPMLAVQAMLHTLCKQMKKDKDQRDHLFKYLAAALERLHVIDPIGGDQSLAAIRNKYNSIFEHLIMSYQLTANASQVPVADLVVSKYQAPSKEFADPLLVIMNVLPKNMPTASLRYCSQFIEMGLVGRGGYGKVYKAQNRVDNMVYAVKKIRLYGSDEETLTTVQREVQLMATLKHSNIVAYFSSWWETGNSCSDSSDSLDGSISSYSKSTSNNGNYKSANSRKYKGLPVTLYIQMELCQNTLETHLIERNDTLVFFKDHDPFDVVDAKFSFEIFQQILIGVEYIHSKSMIHRDLKPSNVFVDKEKRLVQIGDFGLARKEWIAPIEEPYTPFIKPSSSFTANLGTASYAAPEQLGGSNYDKKVDMYSLGLIDFELFYPFSTKMERAKTMQSLREHEGNISELEKIKNKWPLQVNIIQKLLCHNQCHRPSASEVLKMCPKRSDKDHIRELQEQLGKKDQLIKSMGDRIIGQENHIKRIETQKKRLYRYIGNLSKKIKGHASGDSSSMSE